MTVPNPFGFKDPREPTKNIRSVLSDGIHLVLDVAANVRPNAKAFCKAFPNDGICGFEPVKMNFHKLSGDCVFIDRAKTANIVISDMQKEAYLLLAKDSGYNSIEFNLHSGLSQKTITLDRIDQLWCDNHLTSIDVLKIDVEGRKELVLRSAENMLTHEHIKSIRLEVEFYSSAIEPDNLHDTKPCLEEYDFQIFSSNAMQPAYNNKTNPPRHSWAKLLFIGGKFSANYNSSCHGISLKLGSGEANNSFSFEEKGMGFAQTKEKIAGIF